MKVIERPLFLFLLFLFLVIVTAIPADGPDPSVDVAWSLWHPSSLGAPLAGQYRNHDPLGVLSFPHLHGLANEARLSAAGGGIVGRGTSGAALGLIVPGRRIVWNGGLSVLGDDIGFHTRGTLALARPLSGRLVGGAGAGFVVAGDDSSTRFGAGFDLGVRYDVGVFRDFSRVDIHAALLNIGASVTREDYDALIPAFTPVLGVRARVVDASQVNLDLSGTLRAPAFSGFGYDFGAALVFAGGAAVQVGWRGTSGASSNGLWPGFTLGVRFPLGEGRERNGPSIYLAGQPDRSGNILIAGEFSTGFETTDQQPPAVSARMLEPEATIATGLPERLSLSPNGENAQIGVEITAEDNHGIREIRSRIVREDGTEVRSWSFAPIASTVPSGTLTERLVSDLWPRIARGTLYWDVFDDVPDGLYMLRIEAEDRAGNVRRLPAMEIEVDGQPPFMEAIVVPITSAGNAVGEEIVIRAGDTEDMQREVRIAPEQDVRFSLLYRETDRLVLSVVDEAGRNVVPLSAQPEQRGEDQVLSLTWPGTERDGTRIPEGVYRIKAEARDALGNEAILLSPPLLIQSVRPRFTLALSDVVVAPTGDGNRDTLTVRPRLDPVQGLEEWSLEVIDDNDEIVAQWSGIDLPPDEILLGREHFPRDGRYRVRARSHYRNGSTTGDESAEIIVDTRPPEIDFVLDRTRVQPETERVVSVLLERDQQTAGAQLRIRGVDDTQTRLVREWTRVPQRFDWQLLLDDGSLLEAGSYRLYLEAWDSAGNRSRTVERSITILERLGGVGIVPERTTFGPTGNGRFDSLRLLLAGGTDLEAPGTFTIVVVHAESGQAVRRFSGTVPLPRGVTWDGRDDQGQPVRDGAYRAILTVEAPGRGIVEDESLAFSVNTRPPEVALNLSPKIVSPDGDGRQDELMLEPTLPRSGTARYRLFRAEEEIGGRMPDPDAGSVAWIPRLDDGTLLPDGDYSIRLEVEDEAGNTGRSDTLAFTVDTRPVSGFVRINPSAFSPESDARPRAVFTPVLPVTEGLTAWEFRISPENMDEQPVLVRSGREVLPAPVEWDGRNELRGGQVVDGYYTATLYAEYHHGPIVEVTSPPVLLDTTPPDVRVDAGPRPFSPDGDGEADTVEFLIAVDDASPIQYWILEIFDPVGEFFYDVGGRGEPPSRVRWDGRARNNELVVSAEEYPWRLEVGDTLGNVGYTEGTLLVDVLVEPYEDGYRIQLPSITFPPNSAVLNLDADNEVGNRNRTVVNRLVEILQRFPDYAIVVEGHAVNLSGTEREQREELMPLSRRRAEAVRRVLIESGVPARLLTAEGRGGAAPIVPHTDEINRWRNRRVDFLLKR